MVPAPINRGYPPAFESFASKWLGLDAFVRPSPHVFSWGEILTAELSRIYAYGSFDLDSRTYRETPPRCVSPLPVYHGAKYTFARCRKCLYCRRARSAVWLNRYKLASIGTAPLFITLTYNDFSVSTLSVREYQNYLKRLRYFGLRFSYSVTGEYGPKTARPHFHILAFFEDPPEDLREIVRSAWSAGIVTIATPTDNHLYYLANYAKADFVVHETFTRHSLKSPVGKSSSASLRLARLSVDVSEPLVGASGNIFSSYSQDDLVDYGVLSRNFVDDSKEIFCDDFVEKPVLSLADLDLYIKELHCTYEKFLQLKL